LLSGIGAGGVSVLVPLYVSEISEDKVRGTLGSLFIFSLNLGTLLMFIAGSYLSYSLVPKLMLMVPITFILTFLFMHETPQYLIKRGKIEQAESSLKFLRGCSKFTETPPKVKQELLNMKLKVGRQLILKDESIFESTTSR
jgi:MFS family permease